VVGGEGKRAAGGVAARVVEGAGAAELASFFRTSRSAGSSDDAGCFCFVSEARRDFGCHASGEERDVSPSLDMEYQIAILA